MPELPASILALLKREGTGISWCDLTFNPWIGCTKVSPACRLCYAEALARDRLGVPWGPGAERRRTKPGNWLKPLRWQKIAAAAGVVLDVFCLSLGDWADNEVPDEWRADLADIIRRAPNLRWLLLTKRIPNAERMLRAMFLEGVPPNVCLGITVVTQVEVDRDLARAVATKRALGIRRLFLSMEPLLEPVHLPAELMGDIDQVIVGGESGKEARPLDPDAVEALERQCDYWLVPFHFKQWGEFMPDRIERHDSRSLTIPIGHVNYQRIGVKRAGRRLHGIEHLARIPA